MSTRVQTNCPACGQGLRIPLDWLGQPLRCKFCGTFIQMQKRPPMPVPEAAAAAAVMPTAPTAAVPPGAPIPTPMPVPVPTSGMPPEVAANALPGMPAAPQAYPQGYPPPGYPPGYAPPGYPQAGYPQPGYAPPGQQPYPPPYPGMPGYPNDPNAAGPMLPGMPGAGYSAPPTEAPSTNSEFKPAFSTASSKHRGKGKYTAKTGNNKLVLILGGGMMFLLMVVTVLVVAILNPDITNKIKQSINGENSEVANAENKNAPVAENGANNAPAGIGGAFPRRLLAINICNYLYANPIHNGRSPFAEDDDQRDIHGVVSKIAQRWWIPKDQVYELSDSLRGKDSRPPLKKMVMDTIDRFVQTTRAQDRIILLFAGHAIAKDGKAYLVPMEGELDDVETLIPMEWVFDQLSRCTANQKLLVLDVNRYDPGRGTERPSAGAMSEELAKILHTPPQGVQVWTSCSAKEFSHEYDYQGYGGHEIFGSVFFSSFFYASSKGKLGGGIPKPEDPLPLSGLIETVNGRVTETMNFLKDGTQTPALVGEPPVTQVSYNPSEPSKTFTLPQPPQGAAVEEIAQLLKTIEVPSIKIARKDGVAPQFEKIYPFPVEVMKDYAPDNVDDATIYANPDKYPLRFWTLMALRTLRELRESTSESGNDAELPEEFTGETSDAAKKQILALQRIPAVRQTMLESLLKELTNVEPYREMEKSKRWLASYDFAVAQTKIRLAYLVEYNLMLGKVRKDELPPLDMEKGHKGWRLASTEKMRAPAEIRELVKEARDTLNSLIEDHKDTPFAVLAKRDKNVMLGLEWQPSSFGQR